MLRTWQQACRPGWTYELSVDHEYSWQRVEQDPRNQSFDLARAFCGASVLDDFSLEIRGDNTKLTTPRSLTVLSIKIGYDVFGAIANESKYGLYQARVEFLDQLCAEFYRASVEATDSVLSKVGQHHLQDKLAGDDIPAVAKGYRAASHHELRNRRKCPLQVKRPLSPSPTAKPWSAAKHVLKRLATSPTR